MALVLLFPICSKAESNYKACTDGELKLSVKCNEDDVITFSCSDCSVQGVYSGYSSVSINGNTSYYKSYSLKFSNIGTHNVSAYKNGVIIQNFVVTVYSKHDFGNGTIKKKATCEKDGKILYVCNNCEQEKEEVIKATGHDYIETILTNPTCKYSGSKKLKCKNCTDCKYEDIPKLEHNYETVIINPTCSSYGSKSDVCTYCKDEINYEEIEKLEHNYGDWKITKKATIFKNGIEEKVCLSCNDKQEKIIPKIKTKVTLKKKSISLKKGKTYVLKIKKKHSDDKIKSFKSSNKKVATVTKKGKITAKKKGTTKITVTMKSGCKATCKIKVK